MRTSTIDIFDSPNILLPLIKAFMFIVWTTICAIIRIGFLLLRKDSAYLRVIYAKGLCKLLGITVIVYGKLSATKPVIIASNHISWLDIIAFGSVTKLEFISKAELAHWPIIGALAKLEKTVFVERRPKGTMRAYQHMKERLSGSSVLLLFPESTTGNGNHLLPFKSPLFKVAEKSEDYKGVTIQPAAIAYTRLNGLPVGFGWRWLFAWYGNMALGKHIIRFLKLHQTTIEISFLEPLDIAGQADRKTLAKISEQAVRKGFTDLISGKMQA
jgi:1-acyl-sn-glycerol-3-phosphate acyltransferase